MSKFGESFGSGMNWIKGAMGSAWAFGDRNAPILLTGGGLLLGYYAVYRFWKGSKNAEKAIQKKEADIQSTVAPGEDILGKLKKPGDLPKKEKVAIYLQYCWFSLVLGIASTGLIIGGQKVSLDRLASMYVVAQFLDANGKKKDELIEKLKEKAGIEDGSKEEKQLREEMMDEKYPPEEIKEELKSKQGCGQTMIIDETSGRRFYRNIIDFKDGLQRARDILIEDRRKVIRDRLTAFDFVSEQIYGEKELDEKSYDGKIYSSIPMRLLMELLGEMEDGAPVPKIADQMEIRYYGGEDPIQWDDIVLNFREYLDPVSGFPVVLRIDYSNLLQPTADKLDEMPPW